MTNKQFIRWLLKAHDDGVIQKQFNISGYFIYNVIKLMPDFSYSMMVITKNKNNSNIKMPRVVNLENNNQDLNPGIGQGILNNFNANLRIQDVLKEAQLTH